MEIGGFLYWCIIYGTLDVIFRPMFGETDPERVDILIAQVTAYVLCDHAFRHILDYTLGHSAEDGQ